MYRWRCGRLWWQIVVAESVAAKIVAKGLGELDGTSHLNCVYHDADVVSRM